MKTHLSEINIVYDGARGGYIVTIIHLPENSSNHRKDISRHLMLQGVEEKLKEFRKTWNL